MTETTNYHLSQWAKDDRIRMEDFNADNAKIDAALQGLAEGAAGYLRGASGSYVGTGGSSQTIKVGFKPKFMVILRLDGYDQRLIYLGNDTTVFFTANGSPGRQITASLYTVSSQEQGLYIACDYSWSENDKSIAACNANGIKYAWFALG